MTNQDPQDQQGEESQAEGQDDSVSEAADVTDTVEVAEKIDQRASLLAEARIAYCTVRLFSNSCRRQTFSDRFAQQQVEAYTPITLCSLFVRPNIHRCIKSGQVLFKYQG